MSDDNDTGHTAGMTVETTDDGDVRTVLTATAPDWAITAAAVRVANADEPLDEWHIRELIDGQLNPTIMYETTDGKRDADAVRELAETLEIRDSD